MIGALRLLFTERRAVSSIFCFIALLLIYSLSFINSAFAKVADPLDIDKHYLGSKAPYRPMGTEQPAPPSSLCEIIHIEGIWRHGSRQLSNTRGLDRLSQVFELHAKDDELTPLGRTVYQLIIGTRTKSLPSIGELTSQGQQEHFLLGQRFYDAYQTFIEYPTTKLYFQATAVNRTKTSQDYFLTGLKGKASANLEHRVERLIPPPKSEDATLRPHKLCQSHEKYRKENVKALLSSYLSEAKPTLKQVLSKLFHDSILETYSDAEQFKIVSSLFNLCQLEFNIDKDNPSKPFCALFDEHQLKVIGYGLNLARFYNYGPVLNDKHSIAYAMTCPLLTLFLNRTEQAIETQTRTANLHFAHFETVTPFASLLGLNQPAMNLRPSIVDADVWDTTILHPMATNIQWVVYQCQDKVSIQLLHNEKAISFPIAGCEDKLFCDWHLVKQHYVQRLETLGLGQCDRSNWDLICENLND